MDYFVIILIVFGGFEMELLDKFGHVLTEDITKDFIFK